MQDKEKVDSVICIRVKEMLSEEWSLWLDGLVITYSEDGNSVLKGKLPDQSALRGVLGKLWDMNLTVLSFSFADVDLDKKDV